MRKLYGVLLATLIFSPFVSAHHGPGVRGYDTGQRVVIRGTITKCTQCSGGGHGVLQVQVDSVTWVVTLPGNKVLKRAKLSLDKLKKGRTVEVTGLPGNSRKNDIYSDQITVNGVTILTNGAKLPIG